jgi:hypothetical protein
MKNATMNHKASMAVCTLLATAGLAGGVYAGAEHITKDTTLTDVAVNGGTDTLNPGTTCIRLAEAPAQACTSGFLYIPNNNKHLVVAALTAKASNARVAVYYVADAQAGHCPGHVFTPCSVISINQR